MSARCDAPDCVYVEGMTAMCAGCFGVFCLTHLRNHDCPDPQVRIVVEKKPDHLALVLGLAVGTLVFMVFPPGGIVLAVLFIACWGLEHV